MSNYSPTIPAVQPNHEYLHDPATIPFAHTLVNTYDLSRAINLMANVLYSKAIQHPGYRNDCPEIESIQVLLSEAVTAYLEHVFTYSQCNLGFEYFLQDYLPSIAHYIIPQREVMQWLGDQFAIVGSRLGQCLAPAVTWLDQSGYTPTSIEVAVLQPDHKSLYTIKGVPDSDFYEPGVE